MDSLSGPEPKNGAGARAWLVVRIRPEALAVVQAGSVEKLMRTTPPCALLAGKKPPEGGFFIYWRSGVIRIARNTMHSEHKTKTVPTKIPTRKILNLFTSLYYFHKAY